MPIYRIVQEGLANARNHSKSQQYPVSLMQRGDRLRIEIRDWGVGFDPRHAGRTASGWKASVSGPPVGRHVQHQQHARPGSFHRRGIAGGGKRGLVMALVALANVDCVSAALRSWIGPI